MKINKPATISPPDNASYPLDSNPPNRFSLPAAPITTHDQTNPVLPTQHIIFFNK